jgi:V/A-type H+/Na+-transporting ATPase subunit F
MVKTAVLGNDEFILGFQLAGIKDVIVASDEPMNDIVRLIEKKEHGVVIINEQLVEGLDSHNRNQIEDSVSPVFIPISTKVEQDSLKRLIKKSIGVDLWK